MNTEARMQQTQAFYARWCQGTDWEYLDYEERGGFQLVTLKTNEESILLLADNMHRHWPYISGHAEIPLSLLEEGRGLIEEEKRQLIEMCRAAFQGMEEVA